MYSTVGVFANEGADLAPCLAPGGKRWRDHRGEGALHYVALAGRPEYVAPLVAGGYDVNEPNTLGVTPLGLAAIFGNPRVIPALIAAGARVADVKLTADLVVSPIELIAARKYANPGEPLSAIRALVRAGARIPDKLEMPYAFALRPERHSL